MAHSAVEELAPGLFVYKSAVNTGVIVDEAGRVLLIDPGEGDILDVASEKGYVVTKALFTHHHRDVACGAPRMLSAGVELIVPKTERQWFDSVETYWNSPASRWHIYDVHPHHQMLIESVTVNGDISDGMSLTWGEFNVSAVGTSGHTDGSMTYIVTGKGMSVAFTGDLIYEGGRVWELFSLQKRLPVTTDYHGFMGAKDEVAASLRSVLMAHPNMIVPSHGGVIRDPQAAVQQLHDRFSECYQEYADISALRHYFPQCFEDVKGMEFAAVTPPPAWVRQIGTSWLVFSETGAVFVMDCGYRELVDELKVLLTKASMPMSAVEGLWITHYHDDHVDAIPYFQETFDCPLIASEAVAQVIADPFRWRLPCISPSVARVDRRPHHGESWTWHEFTITAFDFPGQSLHHGGLLFDGHGLRLFFSGDSFTPSGIDDYCAGNRNFLGSDVGYLKCVKILEDASLDLIFNSHVDVGFIFTPQQYEYMRCNLKRREGLFTELMPWSDPNFGIDEAWAYCYPYEQVTKPGQSVKLDVIITNHGATVSDFATKLHLPSALGCSHKDWDKDQASGTVEGKSVGRLSLQLEVPSDTPDGRYVVAVDLAMGLVKFPQYAEAIIVVKADVTS